MAERDLTRDLRVMTTEFVVSTSGVVITPSRVTSGRGCEPGRERKNRHKDGQVTAVFLGVQDKYTVTRVSCLNRARSDCGQRGLPDECWQI
jgi:hypothetical protein